MFFTLLSYLCEGILFYLYTETAWAPRRVAPQPLWWALPAAAAGGTTWHSHQSHPSDTLHVPRLQYLASISNETEKTYMETRLHQLRHRTIKPEERSFSWLRTLQDPRSLYLQDYLEDTKEFICLRLTVPYPVTNLDQNKRELLDKAQKQHFRKREEWIPLSSRFCPQQERHFSLEKEDVGAGSTDPCLAKSELKELRRSILSPLCFFQISLWQPFSTAFPSEDGGLCSGKAINQGTMRHL